MPYPSILIQKEDELGRRPTPNDFDNDDRVYICVVLISCMMDIEREIQECERVSRSFILVDELIDLQDYFVEYRIAVGNVNDVNVMGLS